MLLVAVGRIGRGPEAALFERYNARLRPALSVTELPDGRGTAAEIKRSQARAILSATPDRAFVVALDLAGVAHDSGSFAHALARWRDDGRAIVWTVGGAEGLDRSIIRRADQVLSLGPLTWPHLLARAMLAEQLYRAQSILTGHPYHRAGRPGNGA